MKIKKDVENKIIKVDVSVENIDFSTNCNVGLRTTEYIQQSLNHYPWQSNLAMVFKLWLSELDYNNTYKGNFSS